MHALFVACLFGGVLATALFAFLGHAGGHFHLGGHGHAGTHGQVGAHGHVGPGHGVHHAHAGPHGHAAHGSQAQAGSHAHSGQHGPNRTAPVTAQSGHGVLASSLDWSLSWLSPLSLAAAAAWFGGVGLLAESFGGPLVWLLAALGAILGAALVRAAMGAFIRASTAPLQLTSEGAIGTVNATIRPDAAGEVIYTLEGLHRSAPARSEDGKMIPRGTAVVIVRREGGFAWVMPLDPLAELATDARAALESGETPGEATARAAEEGDASG